MVFSGINNQLSVDAHVPQRLIHLFAAQQRHIEIFVAAEEQCGGLNTVGMKERIADLQPWFQPGFPGRPNLIVVLPDLLVMAVKG